MIEDQTSFLVLAPLAAAAILLIYAAFSDLTRYLIPNWLNLLLASLSPFYFWFSDLSAEIMLMRSAIAVTVLIVGMLMHFRGLVGGGDIKLLASLSLWIPPNEWPLFLLTVLAAGGGLALVVLALRKMKGDMSDSFSNQGWRGRLLSRGVGIPYGVAIAIAGLASIWQVSGL